jgi:predicted transposase YbfD/YdcC
MMKEDGGELRLPDVAAIVGVERKVQLKDRCRHETRYYITSAKTSAETMARAVRGHWAIENQLHWALDVTFNQDQSHLRKGHGAKNMAVVRHFALNLVRQAVETPPPPLKPAGLRRKTGKPNAAKRPSSIKLRRKVAGWDTHYLATVLRINP